MTTRRVRFLTVITGLVGLVTVAVLVIAGMTFRDRILEEWYLWQLESENPETRERAAEGLGKVGTARAIAALMDASLRYARNTWEDSASVEQTLSSRSHLEMMLAWSRDQSTRKYILKSYRDSLRSKFPAKHSESLLQLVEREGAAAILRLTDRLSHNDWRARSQAVLLLAELGPKATSSIPQLERVAEGDANRTVRRLAFDAVLQIQRRYERGPNLLRPRGDGDRYNGVYYDGIYPPFYEATLPHE